ncbi:MAG: uncharacterized protein QG670_2038 [Thermoproteota archaeon]|nr:uncharacterized protein [Thermoproteota archaeon]
MIEGWGHPNVTAVNSATFEVTREDYRTRRGDCIVAVNATKGAADLSEGFRRIAAREDTKITVILEVEDWKEVINGWGNPLLTFTHPTDLVARKSNFTCNRTLMIKSDKVAKDFRRELIELLRNPKQKTKITLIAESSK